MFYNGLTILIGYLGRIGTDFWAILPVFNISFYWIITPFLYSLTARGKINKYRRKIKRSSKPVFKGGLEKIKRDEKIDGLLTKSKALSRKVDLSYKAEALLISAYVCSSGVVCCISRAVLELAATSLTECRILSCFWVGLAFVCGFALVNYLNKKRILSIININYIKER